MTESLCTSRPTYRLHHVGSLLLLIEVDIGLALLVV
jgi:hypothetical protein